MLRLLRIRNLAVIEAVDVEFEPGFNVLTGETGAGKSIVVEAVSLLLGARASADLVRTGETLATIEALFEDPSTPLGAGGEVVVRRELTNLGRSRSFINGALATAGALRELSVRLVELHGQHEHQTLLDPLSHLSILDEYAGAGELVSRVAGAWAALRTIREQVERSRMDEREKSARLDLIAFQLRELEKAVPQPGEDEALAATRQVLASADRIQRLCEESYAALYESDDAVLATLGGVWKRVSELAAIDPQFASYVEARESIKAQLDDLAFFLRSYGQGVDASPARLQDVEDRLALLERLKRKYGPTLDEVIARAQALARERELLTGEGARLEDLQAALTDAGGRYLIAARELSERRRTAAREFARKIEGVLADLAMARTRFEVRFNASELGPEAWTERGVDRGEFYVSPNPGEELRPLARIVSGGELSRLMLAIKTLALNAQNDSRPHLTLVFDEVDAGIGGRVADVVGARLAALGARFQVLCITHLPQIAARGATHFRIDKQVRSGRTITTVERLGEASRVDELARIIGGNVTSEAVRTTARELLASAAASPESGAGSRGRRRPGGEEAKGESERRKSRR
ncbi:MAG: DNA repair protein RecN [Acidobacteria bacterium RIFCSPLOWO2_02_FULL_67_21]|nr:MAG: DNA repair protein RecN [Acidobacteria bacterium RIFCSPLOWO2_02_FULL_67_21]